ncbi:MAG: YedE family putative selenium transporter [Deltaproteobacteria bacterium]|nr:YedE family putative selenium transporter [Deltaproteobacteria bacterium]
MQTREWISSRWFIALSGLLIGLVTAFLSRMGNPFNGGIAPTCFIRDTAGALGLHAGAAFQYLRPELAGLVLGGFLSAAAFKEFRPRGGSAPLLRFFLAMLLMVGALTFLGCPTRVIVRLAGGDGNALAGLGGMLLGIFGGVALIKRGFDLGRNRPLPPAAGFVAPLAAIGLLLLIFLRPAFVQESTTGWGAEHAAVGISLVGGLVIGALAQRTRLCFMGAWRDLFLLRDTQLLTGVVAFFLGCLGGNLFFGQFQPGFADQPLAHSHQLWNFLGMVLVGLAAAMLGACPLRQMVLTGQGDHDAAVTVLGMVAGAALTHNFDLSSCSGKIAEYGPPAVIAALVLCLALGLTMRPRDDA